MNTTTPPPGYMAYSGMVLCGGCVHACTDLHYNTAPTTHTYSEQAVQAKRVSQHHLPPARYVVRCVYLHYIHTPLTNTPNKHTQILGAAGMHCTPTKAPQ